MKKSVVLLIALILLITPLSGCEDYDIYCALYIYTKRGYQ